MEKAVSIEGREYGYQVGIHSPQAALSDYAQAMESFITGEGRFLMEKKEYCEGCGGCCWERVPVTAVDLKILKSHLGEDLEWRMFFQRFFWVRVFGQVVDIVLAREDSGACVFLDAIKGLCRVYPYRPLVCRTYICAQASRSAKLLRSALVNGGEDAAVRLWYARTEAKGLVIHEWEDFDPEALMIPQKSVWDTKKRYEDILIREVLPEKLWKRLEGKL